MAISFDKALGSHEKSLIIQSRRASVISSNIVNADTPGYKAKDVDFKQVLKRSQGGLLNMKTTSAKHMRAQGMDTMGVALKYRIPLQPALDGNTVNLDQEKSAYAENALRYQTTLQFLTGRFKGIKGALRGE